MIKGQRSTSLKKEVTEKDTLLLRRPRELVQCYAVLVPRSGNETSVIAVASMICE